MKHDGIIGLFPDDNPESDCAYRINLLRGDEGVSLSAVLPEEMGLVRTQDDITDEMVNFLKAVPYWLCDMSQWDREYKKALKTQTPGAKGEVVVQPPFDLDSLKLILSDGSVDKNRMIQLFRIVGKCWKLSQPKMGLICQLISSGWDMDVLEEVLVRFLKGDSKHSFGAQEYAHIVKMFIPPDCRDGQRVIKPEEIKNAITWYLRPQDKNLPSDDFFNVLSLMELNILDSNKKVNLEIVERAADFVWNRQKDEPDFFRLKEYLSGFKVSPSPLPPKKLSKSALQKLKKLKRKKGKIKRRRK